MMLQEQLAQSPQSQRTPVFPMLDFFLSDLGTRGNEMTQVPSVSIPGNFTQGLVTPRGVTLPVRENVESVEMAWLERNARELGQHQGEWLLIQGPELLVHSRDFAVLRTVIREQQIRSPFVYYVPMDEETNSVTI